MLDREAMALQQAVQEALCSAAGGVQKVFVDALEFVDRSLNLVVEHWKRVELARARSSSAHSASREQRQSKASPAFDIGAVLLSNTLLSSAPAFLFATNPCDHSSWC